MHLKAPLIAALLLTFSGTAWTHGNTQHKPSAKKPTASAEETELGRPGDPRKVTRTIRVEMDDAMRFNPQNIRVRQGETVKFVVVNKGKLLHEMVLGTPQQIAEHAELMKKFPDMEHDEPNMAHAEPGKTAIMVWQFTRAGEFQFACLVPGHMEAGMHGRLAVRPAQAQPVASRDTGTTYH